LTPATSILHSHDQPRILNPDRNVSDGGEVVQVGQSETAEEPTEVPFAQEVPIASLFAGVRLKGTDRDLAAVDDHVDIIPARAKMWKVLTQAPHD
jgi:hypothetical protein